MRALSSAIAVLTVCAGSAHGQRVPIVLAPVSSGSVIAPARGGCSGTRVGAVAKGIGIGLGLGVGALILARPDGVTNEHARQNERLIILGTALIGGAYEWFHYGSTHKGCDEWLPNYALNHARSADVPWAPGVGSRPRRLTLSR